MPCPSSSLPVQKRKQPERAGNVPKDTQQSVWLITLVCPILGQRPWRGSGRGSPGTQRGPVWGEAREIWGDKPVGEETERGASGLVRKNGRAEVGRGAGELRDTCVPGHPAWGRDGHTRTHVSCTRVCTHTDNHTGVASCRHLMHRALGPSSQHTAPCNPPPQDCCQPRVAFVHPDTGSTAPCTPPRPPAVMPSSTCVGTQAHLRPPRVRKPAHLHAEHTHEHVRAPLPPLVPRAAPPALG